MSDQIASGRIVDEAEDEIVVGGDSRQMFLGHCIACLRLHHCSILIHLSCQKEYTDKYAKIRT